MSLFSLLMATFSCVILYIIHRRESFRLSSRLRQFRCCSMSLTLDVFPCLFVTNLAALRWTISILFMSFLIYGSHTVLAYSKVGLTSCSLTDVEPILRFLRKKIRVLFALVHMLLTWDSHFRSD